VLVTFGFRAASDKLEMVRPRLTPLLQYDAVVEIPNRTATRVGEFP
jgi:hypothetical protein